MHIWYWAHGCAPIRDETVTIYVALAWRIPNADGEENDRLTQVGRGRRWATCCGATGTPWLRLPSSSRSRPAGEAAGGEPGAVPLAQGELGLMAERCPHRGASMVYGIPEDGGLRCPYHGWKFSAEAVAWSSRRSPRQHIQASRTHPGATRSGDGRADLGVPRPAPAPLLPRFDLFVCADIKRRSASPCCRATGSSHGELAGPGPPRVPARHYGNYMLDAGQAARHRPSHHLKIGFDVFEYGISKRRLLEGQTEDNDDWHVGHPILFPNILAVGDASRPEFQIRVPMDDAHTLHYWYIATPARARRRRPGAEGSRSGKTRTRMTTAAWSWRR